MIKIDYADTGSTERTLSRVNEIYRSAVPTSYIIIFTDDKSVHLMRIQTRRGHCRRFYEGVGWGEGTLLASYRPIGVTTKCLLFACFATVGGLSRRVSGIVAIEGAIKKGYGRRTTRTVHARTRAVHKIPFSRKPTVALLSARER